jgi:hypothetical protein
MIWIGGGFIPIIIYGQGMIVVEHDFLLLDNSDFLLLDGSNFLLLS